MLGSYIASDRRRCARKRRGLKAWRPSEELPGDVFWLQGKLKQLEEHRNSLEAAVQRTARRRVDLEL